MVSDDGNNIPALREVAESDLFLKNKNTPLLTNRVFLDEVPYARDWAFNPGPYLTVYAVNQLISLAQNNVLLGYDTPLSALQKIEVELNKMIENQKRVTASRRFLGSAMFYFKILIAVAALFVVVQRHKKNSHRIVEERGEEIP